MCVWAKGNNVCCDCAEMASSDVTCYSINVVYVCVWAKGNNVCCDCVEMASSDVTCYSINVVYVCGQ